MGDKPSKDVRTTAVIARVGHELFVTHFFFF